MSDAQEPKFNLESPGEIKPANKTVKLDNNKSKFSKQAEQKQNFEKRAEEVHNKIVGRQDEIYSLGSKFLEIVSDKTLLVNKGPLQRSLEKETLNKLINFAINLNNDDDEPMACMGSISLLTLMFRISLLTRDKYNAAEDKIEKLEGRVSQLEEQLKSSGTAQKDVK